MRERKKFNNENIKIFLTHKFIFEQLINIVYIILQLKYVK